MQAMADPKQMQQLVRRSLARAVQKHAGVASSTLAVPIEREASGALSQAREPRGENVVVVVFSSPAALLEGLSRPSPRCAEIDRCPSRDARRVEQSPSAISTSACSPFEVKTASPFHLSLLTVRGENGVTVCDLSRGPAARSA